ncbi:MAG: nuclear transport factor 2 family protein [Pseudomonadota bacterium]
MAVETETRSAVERFNIALDAKDFDGLAAAMTEDCVFEDTDPRPDGTRFEGRAAVLDFFRGASGTSRFALEEPLLVIGDRCLMRWDHRWVRGGVEGNNRGVDIFRVRDGLVCEKLSYTKSG